MRKVPSLPLWLGHRGDAGDLPALFATGIEAVVDLAADEPPATLARTMVYCRIPLLDGADNPNWAIQAAVNCVLDLLRADVPTLVCCSAGMNRSVVIAGVAAARIRGWPIREGLVFAAGDGPADLSPTFVSQILELQSQTVTK